MGTCGLSFNSINDLSEKIIQAAKDIEEKSKAIKVLEDRCTRQSQRSLLVLTTSAERLKLLKKSVLTEDEKVKLEYLRMFTFNDYFRQQELDRLYDELQKV